MIKDADCGGFVVDIKPDIEDDFRKITCQI